MQISLDFMQKLQSGDAAQVWSDILAYAWEICSAPLNMAQDISEDAAETGTRIASEITKRDRKLAPIDLFLATAGWELWAEYERSADRAAEKLTAWWAKTKGGKAVLLLDALSLREVPWLLEQAEKRGYRLHRAEVAGAELPADTTAFAKALGFSSRSALENNGAGKSHRMTGAFTDSVNLPWEDCADSIQAQPQCFLWHHWPDERIHQMGEAGKGISALVPEMMEQLGSDGFWKLVEVMSTGRRLLITSDHGYAVSGNFPDVDNKEQAAYLKKFFKARRWSDDCEESGKWVPPIDLILETTHGRKRFVPGRRKWKSQGGYPTLTHGGLSVLEVAVPFIELSR